jgi:hypothetical protein
VARIVLYIEDEMDEDFCVNISKANLTHILDRIIDLSVFNLVIVSCQNVLTWFIKLKALFPSSWNKYTKVVECRFLRAGNLRCLIIQSKLLK